MVESNQDKHKGIKAAKALVSFFARPATFIWRLANDERYRVKMNFHIKKKSMKLGASPIHKRVFVLALIGLAGSILAGSFLATALGRIFSMLTPLITGNISLVAYLAPLKKTEVSYGLIFFAAVSFSNILYFLTYEWRYSARKQILRAFSSKGIGLDHEGNPKKDSKLRVYSNRLIELEETSNCDKLHEDVALWRMASFNPSEPIILDGGNRYLFVASALKPSTSTVWADRIPEWRRIIADTYVGSLSQQIGIPQEARRSPKWYYGEYVNQNDVKLTKAEDAFSGSFVGMSGSGKTEAMKPWILHAKITNPTMRLVISDLKAGGDWQVFKDYTEFGRILYSPDETFKALAYLMSIFEARVEHIQRKGYSNIRQWMEAEQVDVPIYLLIIDEFPELVGRLKYEQQEKKSGTPANILFTFMTRGRSYGVWTFVASQFGNYDYIPASISKNITSKVILKVGSSGEANLWLDGDLPFNFGKGMMKNPDGSIHAQKGYACVDKVSEYVRFWYLSNPQILGEFERYKVPKTVKIDEKFIPAADLKSEAKPIIPADTTDKPINLFEKIKWKLFPSMKPNDAFVKEFPLNEPLSPLPLPEETFEDYAKRVIPKFMGVVKTASPTVHSSSTMDSDIFARGSSSPLRASCEPEFFTDEDEFSTDVPRTPRPSTLRSKSLKMESFGEQTLSPKGVKREGASVAATDVLKKDSQKPSGVEGFISSLKSKSEKKL